jgi:hypothetical protein
VTVSLILRSCSRIGGVDVEDTVVDVVAQGADVGDVVVEPFQFQQDPADPLRVRGYRELIGVFDRAAEGEGVPDGGVAADPFGQFDRLLGTSSMEQPLQSSVDEPEPGLEFQNGLSHDGEPEVAGADHPGVHRADRDLVHTRPLDRAEGIRAVDVAELRWVAGVGQHRIPALRPMEMANQPPRQRVTGRHDAEQVTHLPLEPSCRKGQTSQAGHVRGVSIQRNV